MMPVNPFALRPAKMLSKLMKFDGNPLMYHLCSHMHTCTCMHTHTDILTHLPYCWSHGTYAHAHIHFMIMHDGKVCVCACVRVCVRAHARACVCACVCACVRDMNICTYLVFPLPDGPSIALTPVLNIPL